MTIEELSTRFPIRVHEDAGPFSKNLSMDVLSWSSVNGRGTEAEVKYSTIARKVYSCFMGP